MLFQAGQQEQHHWYSRGLRPVAPRSSYETFIIRDLTDILELYTTGTLGDKPSCSKEELAGTRYTWTAE